MTTSFFGLLGPLVIDAGERGRRLRSESQAAADPGLDSLVREGAVADQTPSIPSALIQRADLSGGAASRTHSGSCRPGRVRPRSAQLRIRSR
ncbi:hypothetical protein [Streptomyces sp. NBC_01515]|uniref:hypothetical protein n=1 Tax=Streptomyces sp. NBC_01515 TaxID=2903890 RepID=UPI00386BD5EA